MTDSSTDESIHIEYFDIETCVQSFGAGFFHCEKQRKLCALIAQEAWQIGITKSIHGLLIFDLTLLVDISKSFFRFGNQFLVQMIGNQTSDRQRASANYVYGEKSIVVFALVTTVCCVVSAKQRKHCTICKSEILCVDSTNWNELV